MSAWALGMNAPVAYFIGIGQRGAGNCRAKTHVIELGRPRREARFDVAQALSLSELRKGHAAKLLGATQGAPPMIAAIASGDAMRSFPRQKVYHLREQRRAKVHSPLRPKQGRRSVTGEFPRSSLRHLDSSWEPHRYWPSEHLLPNDPASVYARMTQWAVSPFSSLPTASEVNAC